MYLYETHMHTAPLSACARVPVRDVLQYYQSEGYAGVFLTDHFIDGNINPSLRSLPYDEKIEAYFDALDEAQAVGQELGISTFPGFEMSYQGTDFLVYGMDRAWCLAHKDMDQMPKTRLLQQMMADGALLIQAHPFREASYIDHIRLFPRCVHGVEVFNACRSDFENAMAEQYCQNYSLIPFAGSDNHVGSALRRFGGMATESPLKDVREFVDLVLSRQAKPFIREGSQVTYL